MEVSKDYGGQQTLCQQHGFYNGEKGLLKTKASTKD